MSYPGLQWSGYYPHVAMQPSIARVPITRILVALEIALNDMPILPPASRIRPITFGSAIFQGPPHGRPAGEITGMSSQDLQGSGD